MFVYLVGEAYIVSHCAEQIGCRGCIVEGVDFILYISVCWLAYMVTHVMID